MSLKIYNRKRKFNKTPEPPGKVKKRSKKGAGDLRFVVQMHRATRLHYDVRLEFGGVFRSWAVPRGPSLNPLDQRLAVFVEDHPLEYGSFEGIIPKGNYGAGTVMVWDEGTYVERGSETREQSDLAMQKAFDKGHITFVLNGKKLKGEFALIRLKKGADDKPWLLVKKRDEHSTYKRTFEFDETSAKTGRSLNEIAAQAEAQGHVWRSKRTTKEAQKPTTAKIEKPLAKKPVAKAPRAVIPRQVKPMIATAGRQIPEGNNWIFEKDQDGLRSIAEVEGRRTHLYSKSKISFDKKYPQIMSDLQKLENPMVLDGKILTEKKNIVFEVFDILYFDGRDLRGESLKARLKILNKAFTNSTHLRKTEPMTSVEAGTKIVAKNLNSLYKSGTSADWLQLAVEKVTAGSQNTSDEPKLTHLEKIFWPVEKITKGDLIDYYRSVAPFILPHLKDRPQSLNRFPNGIAASGFYQKDMTGHIPRWLKTERVFSESADKTIDYALCQDERSLLYLVNLGCIEMNPWFSRKGSLDKPDFLVIDLDPDDNDFSEVIEVAHATHEILESIGAKSFCKTSGATGIHIGVPTGAKYDFDSVREFAKKVCQAINKKFSTLTSLERSPARRRKKIYLDFMQNRRGQTLASAYCVRPKSSAPVSMPLAWKDLKSTLRPEDFNIHNALRRLEKVGDLWRPILNETIDLAKCSKNLGRKFGKS